MTIKYAINDSKIKSSSRNVVNIFGIKLVSISKQKVLKEVEANIRKKHKFLLLTPNPEILLESRKNKELQDVLNNADINIADGVGIRLAYKYLTRKGDTKNLFTKPKELTVLIVMFFNALVDSKEDVPFPVVKGRELFKDLIELSAKNSWKVFLLGGENGVWKRTENIIRKKYKNLEVKSTGGPMLNRKAVPLTKKDNDKQNKVVRMINGYKPDLVFVAFGAPKQEIWSKNFLDKLNTKGIMVVGGTFDYVSGMRSEPPDTFSSFGLEWLWRLITQPKRFRRIFNATFVYPYLLYKQKISGN